MMHQVYFIYSYLINSKKEREREKTVKAEVANRNQRKKKIVLLFCIRTDDPFSSHGHEKPTENKCFLFFPFVSVFFFLSFFLSFILSLF